MPFVFNPTRVTHTHTHTMVKAVTPLMTVLSHTLQRGWLVCMDAVQTPAPLCGSHGKSCRAPCHVPASHGDVGQMTCYCGLCLASPLNLLRFHPSAFHVTPAVGLQSPHTDNKQSCSLPIIGATELALPCDHVTLFL